MILKVTTVTISVFFLHNNLSKQGQSLRKTGLRWTVKIDEW